MLSALSKSSLPTSQLSAAEKVNGTDLFIVERVEGLIDHYPIFQESHQSYTEEQIVAGDVVDAILLELGTVAGSSREFLYNELHSGIIGYLHSNGKTTYADLSSRLLADLSNAFEFRSMSQEDTSEYARAGHDHYLQYSDTRVFPWHPTKTDDTQCWLGNFVVWQQSDGKYTSNEISVYTPELEYSAKDNASKPDVGEVRFMGWPSIESINKSNSPIQVSAYQTNVTLVADAENGGWWAVCNGASVNCQANRFQDACQFFAGNPRATQFTLPSLNNFIMPNPGTNMLAPTEYVEHVNGLSSHCHQLEQPSESTQTFELKGTITIQASNYGENQSEFSVHSGKQPRNDSQIGRLTELTCTFNPDQHLLSIPTTTIVVGDDKETKPKHNKTLALVYIGEF